METTNPTVFWKSWAIFALALLLVLGYELAFPHYSALHGFKSYLWDEQALGILPEEEDSTRVGILSVADSLAAALEQDSLQRDSLGGDSLAYRPGGIFGYSPAPGQADSLWLESYVPISIDCLRLATQDQLAYQGKERLQTFFEALGALKNGQRKKVRIAYFGDSTTEGDLCVAFFRAAMQQRFGGKGVGFAPVVQHGTRFRQTIKQQYDGGWLHKDYLHAGNIFDFGLTGDYATSAYSGAESRPLNLKFNTSAKAGPGLDRFHKVYLYYGRGKEGAKVELTIKFAEGETKTMELAYSEEAVTKVLISSQETTGLDLNFKFLDGSTPIYGLSFEDETGIYVDNLAKRGDSGSNFRKIKPGVFQAFRKHMPYDLIILQYGPNVLSTRRVEYGFYETHMVNNISYLKTQYPGVPILVISNPDKASRVNGELRTDPAVYGLLKAQSRAAMRTESAFFNLFAAMGGEGSMVKWVHEAPTRASSDYIHFNGRGGQEVAKFLQDYLFAEQGALK